MDDNQIIIPEGWTYFVHRTIPKRLLEFYKKEITKKQCRTIEIQNLDKVL